MKLVTTLVAASLILASAQVMAITSSYHISGTPIVGTATLKSSGSCKLPSQKFINAQYGQILDSSDAAVGEGVIDATGNKLLAIVNQDAPYYYSYVFQDATPGKQKTDQKYMISFVGVPLLQYIASEAGCAPYVAWATPAAFWEMKQDISGGKINLVIKQPFVGLSDLSPLCVTKGLKQTCKGNKFTGGLTFTGQSLIPGP